jgi:hypothetical protein
MTYKNETPEVEVIELKEDNTEHYYRVPRRPHARSFKIPLSLFEKYTHHRDNFNYYKKLIKEYIHPTKDKPMYVAKNHIEDFGPEPEEHDEIVKMEEQAYFKGEGQEKSE